MEQSITIEEYKQQMHRMLKMLYPSITNYELDLAIQYSIDKRFKNVDITVNNNYKRKTVNTTLLDVSDIIKTQQPIITASVDLPIPISPVNANVLYLADFNGSG